MKLSQEEANYRRGSPVESCGNCEHFQGHDVCSKVAGKVSVYGVSDEFRPQKNPFGSKIGPREKAMISSMMASGPDESPAVAAEAPPAPTQIGNRSYPT